MSELHNHQRSAENRERERGTCFRVMSQVPQRVLRLRKDGTFRVVHVRAPKDPTFRVSCSVLKSQRTRSEGWKFQKIRSLLTIFFVVYGTCRGCRSLQERNGRVMIRWSQHLLSAKSVKEYRKTSFRIGRAGQAGVQYAACLSCQWSLLSIPPTQASSEILPSGTIGQVAAVLRAFISWSPCC